MSGGEGFVIGVVLVVLVIWGPGNCAAENFHFNTRADKACAAHGGPAARTPNDRMVFCADGTSWRWREGYIVEVKH